MKTKTQIANQETESAIMWAVVVQTRCRKARECAQQICNQVDLLAREQRASYNAALHAERAADEIVATAEVARARAVDEYDAEKRKCDAAVDDAERVLDAAVDAFAGAMNPTKVRIEALERASAAIVAVVERNWAAIERGDPVVDTDCSVPILPAPKGDRSHERRMFTFRITSCEPGIANHSKWFRKLGLPLRGWSFGELALRLHPGSRVVNSCPTWAYVSTPMGDYELEAVI